MSKHQFEHISISSKGKGVHAAFKLKEDNGPFSTDKIYTGKYLTRGLFVPPKAEEEGEHPSAAYCMKDPLPEEYIKRIKSNILEFFKWKWRPCKPGGQYDHYQAIPGLGSCYMNELKKS